MWERQRLSLSYLQTGCEDGVKWVSRVCRSLQIKEALGARRHILGTHGSPYIQQADRAHGAECLTKGLVSITALRGPRRRVSISRRYVAETL